MKTNTARFSLKSEGIPVLLFLLINFLNMPLGSFLLDPFLLLISGSLSVLLCTRVLYKRSSFRGWIPLLYVLIMGNFYFWSVSLYFNKPYADWLWKLTLPFSIHPPASGFNFMLTSGVFQSPFVNPEDAPFSVHMKSGFMFAFYTLWLYLGIRLGYILYGKNEHQTGVVGALM